MMNNQNSTSLGDVYKNHHKERRGDFFILQGGIRGDFLKSKIGTGKKVLDIGCRDGALTSLYYKGNDVTGVDIDLDALARAREKFGITTTSFDLNGEWPLSQGSYDVVVAAEVMEHLYYPDRVLEKISNTLKSGGMLLGSIPNAFSLKNRIRLLFGRKRHTPLADPTHINHFSRKEFERLLADKFTDIKIYPLGKFAFLDRFFPGFFSFMMLFEAHKK